MRGNGREKCPGQAVILMRGNGGEKCPGQAVTLMRGNGREKCPGQAVTLMRGNGREKCPGQVVTKAKLYTTDTLLLLDFSTRSYRCIKLPTLSLWIDFKRSPVKCKF